MSNPDLSKSPWLLIRHEVYPCEEFEGVPVSTMIQIQDSIEKEIQQGGKVVIHCRMGWGRTGTVLGGYTSCANKTTAILMGKNHCSSWICDEK